MSVSASSCVPLTPWQHCFSGQLSARDASGHRPQCLIRVKCREKKNLTVKDWQHPHYWLVSRSAYLKMETESKKNKNKTLSSGGIIPLLAALTLTLLIHLLYPLIEIGYRGSAGAYPTWQRVRCRAQPGQVASLSHTERSKLRYEPKTFLLRGNSANHCTTVPSHY